MQVPKDQPGIDLIGRPLVHSSGFKQATGEAVYCDDIPSINGELYLSLVLSTSAHAKIKNIDTSQALKVEGVVAYFDAKDIPDHCRYVGHIFKDEEVFASEKVRIYTMTENSFIFLITCKILGNVPRSSHCGCGCRISSDCSESYENDQSRIRRASAGHFNYRGTFIFDIKTLS